MIVRILWIALASYFVYKLVFDLIIPLVGTTRKVQKAFNQARQQQQDAHNPGYGPQQQAQRKEKPSGTENDYLDFEEVK
jgi:hypothetical protein